MLTLYIGDKHLSTWSLRAYLMVSKLGMPFEETVISLYQPNTQENILQVSSAGKVPVLKHDDFIIWDTLAIGEYLAETFPEANLWPNDKQQRALARSISAEMHSGFQALRQHLSMNLREEYSNYSIPDTAAKDILRIINIWENCRNSVNQNGTFLFGDFSIADAMFAPVAFRFKMYHVSLPAVTKAYMEALLNWPPMRKWFQEAQN